LFSADFRGLAAAFGAGPDFFTDLAMGDSSCASSADSQAFNYY
jgi:hypothetical protein